MEEKRVGEANLAETYQNFGNIYNYGQDYEKAVDYYLKASELYELKQDTIGLGKIFSNIGGINARLKNREKAIFYMNKALNYLTHDEPLKMQVLTNLSGIYFEEKKIDKAIRTALASEALAKKNNSPLFLGYIYSNLCNFYLEKGAYDTSIDYGLKGVAAKEAFQQNTDVLLNNLGYAYLQQNHYKTALTYFEKISPQAQKDLNILVYNNLSTTHEQLGNTKKALQYAKLYNQLKDSITSVSQQTKVAELTEKYKSEKKEQQISLLNAKNELNTTKLRQQNIYIWSLVLFSILFLALGLLWYRGYKTKQSLKTATIQHRLLQTQLNPHFLFHALNSIQGYIYQNKKEESTSYLSSFSKLMRTILESSDQDFILLTEDIAAMQDYLLLQQLNTSTSFSYEIIVDDNLDTDMLTIPPMLTQPYIENAVFHGIKEVANGDIRVQYSRKEGQLVVAIEDNGKGFTPHKTHANQLHKSMAMRIIADRVENLKKIHQYHCTIAIESTEKGTEVSLKFPLRYQKM